MTSRTWIDAALNNEGDYHWERLFRETWAWTIALPPQDGTRARNYKERSGKYPKGYFTAERCGPLSVVEHARRIMREHGVLTVWVEFNSDYEPVQFDGEMFIGADTAPFITVEDLEKELKRIYNLR